MSESIGEKREPANVGADFEAGRQREREFIERSRQAMTPGCAGWAYLRGRGFTDEEIERLGFGYDEHASQGWRDSTGTWHSGPRVVIPWRGCDYYHIDRAIAPEAKGAKYVKPSAEDVGPQPMFNERAFDTGAEVVFVVEGALDAYAVEAMGYEAVALGGTAWQDVANAAYFTDYHGVVVAMLDFDNPGRENNAELVEYLMGKGVAVCAPGGLGGCNDADAALQMSRAGLGAFLEDVAQNARSEADRAARERYESELGKMGALDPAVAVGKIDRLEDVDEPIPTGLDALDDALGGGLHRGVTVLGAISSLGKTTLTVQMADHMAESGRAVLFVTIEQSARELVAKSLTRKIRERHGDLGIASSDLTDRKARALWGKRQRDAFADASRDYLDTVRPNLRIMECKEQPSVADVRRVAEFMARHNAEPPVVFIDYLQLLKPQNEHDDERRTTDRNMGDLRRMARETGAAVFVISSLNRASYSGSVSLESFKESGGIEYGCDVLLGLQPEGMADKLEGVAESRKKSEGNRIMRKVKLSPERNCEVVVLKNRNGALPAHEIPLTFYTRSALFRSGSHGPGSRSELI